MGRADEIHVLPDTNVLLHFGFFEIPWREELNAKKVVFHISLPVLSELGKLKDEGEPKSIRKRAGTKIKRLGTLSKLQDPVLLRENEILIFEDLPVDCSIHPELNEKFGDHRLIASALKIQREQDSEVTILTADIALEIQLRRFGIRVICPKEKHRQELNDSEDKKRQSLEAELRQLQNQRPKLKAFFSGGEKIMRIKAFTAKKRRAAAEKASQKFVAERRAKVPRKVYKPNKSSLLYKSGLLPSEKKVDEYNEKLEVYYEKSEAWARAAYFIHLGVVDIDIEISNDGEIPANSVSAFFHFPDGFNLADKADLDDFLPEIPQPPDDPDRSGHFAAAMQSLDYSPALLGPPRPVSPSTSSISVKKSNSYDVEFTYNKVRQGEGVSVHKLVALFEGESSSFQISYRLICDNCPTPITGKLDVVFE